MDGKSALLFALLSASFCGAQFTGTFPASTGSSPFSALGPGSAQPVLVDPRRLQTSQSVSMMAVSGGGGSYSQSFVQNRIDYRLSEPLTLHLNLGLLTPMQASGAYAQGLKKGTYLVPDLGLDYKPSESVLFSLRYVSVPSAPLGSQGSLPWN
jgi:hypothetical protein